MFIYFSAFSGIGGFELGIERAFENRMRRRLPGSGDLERPGCRSDDLQDKPSCVGFSEIDRYAKEVYQRHFPEHRAFGDITAIDTAQVPDFDLFVGGFPCQAFSVAGHRRGFSDTRGTLFFEIARIAREKQPRLLLLENVKGLLSHEAGRTFSTIIATLDELGYDTQWQVLNSKCHGVPQNRERIFIVGHLRGTPRPEVFPIREVAANTHERQSASSRKAEDPKTQRHCGHTHEPVTLRARRHIHRRTDSPDDSIHVAALTERRTEEARQIRRNAAGWGFSPRRAKYLDRRTDGIGNCVTASPNREHLLANGSRVRRLTPLECERLQGFPDGWTEGLSDTRRYQCLGNAVTVNVITAIVERLYGV